MEWFMPIYTSLVGVIVGLLIAWIKSLIGAKKQVEHEEDERTKALNAGMAILLRQRLYDYYNAYENEESIPASEWSDIEETHTVYNKLGGNHTGDRLFKVLEGKHIQG